MILVNRNFGDPALSQAIGDMFKSSSDDGIIIDSSMYITNTIASGSTLVSTINSLVKTVEGSTNFDKVKQQTAANTAKQIYEDLNKNPKNFYLVTEHFLKVLDKVYTKLWNESFTETGIYATKNLITLYKGFVSDLTNGENSTYENLSFAAYATTPTQTTTINMMLFKKFVDRCIDAGILIESDRLDYQDQISLNNLNKIDLSTQIDTTNKIISFNAISPIDIGPDVDSREGSYLYGKKLFLMFVPYLPNFYSITGSTTIDTTKEPIESFMAFGSTGSTISTAEYKIPVRRPYAFFQTKDPSTSKFGKSVPLATHFFWRIGTLEEKELALLEGKTGIDVPEFIVDHTDRISHIDGFTLKVKYDKVQF